MTLRGLYLGIGHGPCDAMFPRLKLWAWNVDLLKVVGFPLLGWGHSDHIAGITSCASLRKLYTWTQETLCDVGTHKYIQCLVRSDISTLAHWNQSKLSVFVKSCIVMCESRLVCDCNTQDLVDTLPASLPYLSLHCPYDIQMYFTLDFARPQNSHTDSRSFPYCAPANYVGKATS